MSFSVVFALVHPALYAGGILELSFDTTLQTVFMTIFFCTVGFMAVGICIVQDTAGSALAAMFGLDPLLGLCMGFVPLVGGHGTSGSFGPLLLQLHGSDHIHEPALINRLRQISL